MGCSCGITSSFLISALVYGVMEGASSEIFLCASFNSADALPLIMSKPLGIEQKCLGAV